MKFRQLAGREPLRHEEPAPARQPERADREVDGNPEASGTGFQPNLTPILTWLRRRRNADRTPDGPRLTGGNETGRLLQNRVREEPRGRSIESVGRNGRRGISDRNELDVPCRNAAYREGVSTASESRRRKTLDQEWTGGVEGDLKTLVFVAGALQLHAAWWDTRRRIGVDFLKRVSDPYPDIRTSSRHPFQRRGGEVR
jgi:hypothetical protein